MGGLLTAYLQMISLVAIKRIRTARRNMIRVHYTSFCRRIHSTSWSTLIRYGKCRIGSWKTYVLPSEGCSCHTCLDHDPGYIRMAAIHRVAKKRP
jgi:hypothetical protein